jgi:hypothetical protein
MGGWAYFFERRQIKLDSELVGSYFKKGKQGTSLCKV